MKGPEVDWREEKGTGGKGSGRGGSWKGEELDERSMEGNGEKLERSRKEGELVWS